MQRFFVSKSLAEDMAQLLARSTECDTLTMQWYAHRVPVLGGNCTMAMEANSRYCMVFHEMSDFGRFPSIFRDRLSREVLAVCQTSGSTTYFLADLVKESCRDCCFSLGLDYSISADIYDAARHLQTIVEELGGFPVAGVSEFTVGISLNQQVLPHLSQAKPTSALSAFRDYWLQKLAFAASNNAKSSFDQHWPSSAAPYRK